VNSILILNILVQPMATTYAGGISLHGAADDIDAPKHVSRSAILFKLSQSMLKDLKNASNTKEGLQLLTGRVPVSLSL